MLVNFSDSTALLSVSIEENLYEKLVQQLVKDFGLANITIDFPYQVSPKNLKTILHQKVYRLIMEQFAEYLNLLYIVDVSEKAVKEIEATDVVEIADEVSFLILKREFQKVWLKQKYA
tara:strand:+ start:36904 stop:37257 length:354 start_codon:yes stop_codon:yes gene_type:complete